MYDELSDSRETEEAKLGTVNWEKGRKNFADKYSEPYGEMQMQSSAEHFKNLIEASSDADVLLLAGDIMDYVNGANIRFIGEMLEKASVPFMYVSGNHERLGTLPDSKIFKNVKEPVQKIECDDIIILGIDNSDRLITGEQNKIIEDNLKNGKPVILLMHIPVMTEENEDLLKECGEYFYLNYEGAPKENFEFINLIKKYPENVLAVLAGHLHFGNMSKITEGVVQYTSSQGITGHLNKYIIGD